MADPQFVKFAEWMPDAADRESGLTEAKGVVARAGSYAPLSSPVQIEIDGTPAALDGDCLGAAQFWDSEASVPFAGDASKLYRLISSAVTDVSKAGGYSLSDDNVWDFAQFGANIVAVSENENPQLYTLGSSTDFADLSGSPPQARCVGRIGDHLFLGHDSTVTWSAFNDITDWTADPGTQAGSQTLDQAGGRVQAIVGGLIPSAIFQERQIRRVLFTGGSTIWDFGQEAAETRRGALATHAVVQVGRLIFYASEEGFYVWDGQQSIPIGENKIDRYFLGNLNFPQRHRISAAYDSTNKAVVFGYPAGSATTPSEQLIYSLTDRKWTRDDVPMQTLLGLPQPGFTLETLNQFFGSTDIENWDLSLDSPQLREGASLLAGVDDENTFVLFSGDARQATIDTIETELQPGRRGRVSQLWPIVDVASVASVTARVGARSRPGGTVSFGANTVMNVAGFCPVRTDDRFLRARVRIAAGANWRRAEGVHFAGRLSGRISR